MYMLLWHNRVKKMNEEEVKNNCLFGFEEGVGGHVVHICVFQLM